MQNNMQNKVSLNPEPAPAHTRGFGFLGVCPELKSPFKRESENHDKHAYNLKDLTEDSTGLIFYRPH